MAHKGISVVHEGMAYRWSPMSSFVAVWFLERFDEHVPDDMIEFPEWINRTQVDRDVLTTLITHGIMASSAQRVRQRVVSG